MDETDRRHAVKLLSAVNYLVVDAAYAIGKIVAFRSSKAAACTNSAIITFLDDVAMAEKVAWRSVLRLANPAATYQTRHLSLKMAI